MFYDRLETLCVRNGLKVSAALKIMGISAGNMKPWREGRIPKGKTLRRIAEFFEVPVDFLMGTKQESLSRQHEKLLLLYDTLPEDGRAEIMRQLESASQALRADKLHENAIL